MAIVTVTPLPVPTTEDLRRGRAAFRDELARFRARLPTLLADPTLAGRWVFFVHGDVAHVDADRPSAHRWASAHLRTLAGFVIAEVAEPRGLGIGGARKRAP